MADKSCNVRMAPRMMDRPGREQTLTLISVNVYIQNLHSMVPCSFVFKGVLSYFPTVMWKFPATLLTYMCPCILQALSGS